MIETRDIFYIIDAHTNKAREPTNTVRMFDGETPYYVHPIWCATMLSQETALSEDLRKKGSQALLYHDVLEDTYAGLPDWISSKVSTLIKDMTFDSSEDEWKNLWERAMEVKLLKAYDKTNNLLDSSWMKPERRIQHVTHLKKLVDDVEKNYGDLNILKLARDLY